ncbi:MAG TPA: hypothetical protein VHH36_08580, partial [Candidatus Thermoplasmatota archaeon]|nr:hypothetical protein [Candidatus Thermoplasmatota archaeon]
MGQSSRALALAALLLPSLLAALAPVASAEESALLCLSADEDWDPASCPARVRPAANYQEGDAVRIRAPAAAQVDWIRVRCLEACRDAAGLVFYARFTGEPVTFPDSFGDTGPDGQGDNPRQVRAARYNSTWEAAAVLPAGRVEARTFHVWLVDAFRSLDGVLRPGECHAIRASGFDAAAPVEMRVQRRAPNGTFLDIPMRPCRSGAPPTVADRNGFARFDWLIPKEEAKAILACANPDDCYRLQVSGVGKQTETIALRMAPAVVVLRNQATTPEDGTPEPINRTDVRTLAFVLHYPGGYFAEGETLDPKEDLTDTLAGRDRTLRVIVERYNRTDPSEATYHNETRLVYVPERFQWEVAWTAPRDLPLDDATLPEPSATYRLRLAETRDAHDNRIPSRVLGNYTVTRAEIVPEPVSPPTSLPRTERGVFRFAVKYNNGSVLGSAEAATSLTGCFVREAQATRAGCASLGVEHARATYNATEGAWVFERAYPRDYAAIGEPQLLLLNESLVDRWGNVVRGTRLDGWRVVAGSPRVDFTVSQRGAPADLLVRGSDAFASVTTRYADGSPFNSTHSAEHVPWLNVTLTRRAPGGEVISEEVVRFQETDRRAGRWGATLDLTGDETQVPAGTWAFAFDLADDVAAPNVNATTFTRPVAASAIRLEPRAQPASVLLTGSRAEFRFRLVHDNGTAVARDDLVGTFEGRVHKYDRAAARVLPDPVTGLLFPRHVDATGEWSVAYEIPGYLYSGDYAFVVSGADVHGNGIVPGSASAPFRTESPVVARGVLTQPPRALTRGETATVVFDGREGDTGTPAVGV